MLLFSVFLCAIFVVLRVKVFLSIQNIAFDTILYKQNVEIQEEPACAHWPATGTAAARNPRRSFE